MAHAGGGAAGANGADAADGAEAAGIARTGSGLFAGPGEMRARCRTFDWASTPLGPVGAWPPHLRTAAELVLASGFAMVLHYGPDAVQLYNDACVPSLGPRHPEALGRSVYETFPETRAGVAALHARVRAGETVTLADQALPMARDGVVRDVVWTFTHAPLRDEAGAVAGVVGTAVDVTEQVRARREVERLLAEAEAARAEAERRTGVLAAVIESMPDAVYVGTMAGVTVANRAALELLGYDTLAELNRGIPTLAEEIRTRDPGTGRRLAPEEEAFVRALLGEERVTREVLIRHRRTGQDRLVHAVAMPVRDPGGAVAAAVTVSRDVTEARAAATERERLLGEAEAARAAAEAANQAKGQFLANMSHELRTPLNAIAGYTQLLDMGLHGPVTDAQRAALARVQAAQARLLALVNDVLNYAKLEAGRVEYDMRAVDLRDVVADVAPLIEPQARIKGLVFDVRLPEAPCLVWADREKLGQVLMNLLSNAVKFTPPPAPAGGTPGRVTVRIVTRGGATPDGPPGDGGHAAEAFAFLRVEDTGIGIPRDRQDGIFEPFVQVRTGYAHATEGTGLGLAISRELARGMGGDLTAESTPGVGSTFTVALPAA